MNFSTLLQELRFDNLVAVKARIQKNPDLLTGRIGGRTLLHHAVLCYAVKVVDYLISRGVPLEAMDQYGFTPLINVWFNDEDLYDLDIDRIALALINAGANVNVKDDQGFTPLHYAVRRSSVEVVKLLLTKEANSDALTEDGITSLQIAITNSWNQCGDQKKKSEEIVKLLISVSNVNLKNEIGLTALHTATFHDRVDIVEALLAKGAFLEVQDYDGWTPLFSAVWKGHTSSAEALLKRGARIDTRGFCHEFERRVTLKELAELNEDKKMIELIKKYENLRAKI